MEKGKWIKGSRSTASGNNCVEVNSGDVRVFVRNSKHRRDAVSFTPAEWTAFIESAKLGEFDL